MNVEEHTKEHADKISGYKQLTPAQIERVNAIKLKGNELRDLLDEISEPDKDGNATDPRWLAEARTDLQKGIMSLVRSVCQPDDF